MIGARGCFDLRVADGLVAERLIVHLDRAEMAQERAARQKVVEHLRPPVMQDAPAPVGSDAAVEHDEASRAESAIARVLLGADGDLERRLVVLGIEISGNQNEPVWVVVEKPIDEEPKLEGLGRAAYSRQEVAFRPACDALPDERGELLARNGGR